MAKNYLTKRGRQSQETRKKIFEAAISLIKKKGFDRVTIENICSEANVSIGLFYNYFSSKDKIVVEQFLDIDEYYKKINEKNLKHYRGIDKLLKFVSLQAKHAKYRLGKDLLRNVYRSVIRSDRTGNIILDEKRYLNSFLVNTIEEAQNKGELPRQLNKKEIAFQIGALMRGNIYNWCLFEDDFNIEKFSLKIISTFLDGLKTKK